MQSVKRGLAQPTHVCNASVRTTATGENIDDDSDIDENDMIPLPNSKHFCLYQCLLLMNWYVGRTRVQQQSNERGVLEKKTHQDQIEMEVNRVQVGAWA